MKYDKKLQEDFDAMVKSGSIIAVLDRFGSLLTEPCPFCSSIKLGVNIHRRAHISCGNCGAIGPSFYNGEKITAHEAQDEALKLWNTRG